MDDKQFDGILEEKLSDLTPPKAIIKEVSPLRKAMCRILWGIALGAVSINFFYLDLILPILSSILLLLGFRALRLENNCFTTCWHFALTRTGLGFVALALHATFWYETADGYCTCLILQILISLIVLLQILFLRSALHIMQQKAGMFPNVSGATALLLWYLVMFVLALLQLGGWLLILCLIAALGLILRSLWKIYLATELAGYSVAPAPSRLSDRAFALALCGVVLVMISTGYLFCSRYPMSWEKTNPVQNAAQEKLLALGFPEDVLADLSEEDLQKCADGAKVLVQTDSLLRRDGKTLLATGVAVQSETDARRYHVLLHYRWLDDACPDGTEAILLDLYGSRTTVNVAAGVSGRVLCTRGNSTYAAPFYSTEDVNFYTYFMGNSYRRSLAFSFRPGAADCRSYAIYDIYADASASQPIVADWAYTHQLPGLQYPLRTATAEDGLSNPLLDSFSVVFYF